jgi:hypothetical protein
VILSLKSLKTWCDFENNKGWRKELNRVTERANRNTTSEIGLLNMKPMGKGLTLTNRNYISLKVNYVEIAVLAQEN